MRSFRDKSSFCAVPPTSAPAAPSHLHAQSRNLLISPTTLPGVPLSTRNLGMPPPGSLLVIINHSTGFNSGFFCPSTGSSLIISTDSYFPWTRFCRGGASGCVVGREITIRWRGGSLELLGLRAEDEERALVELRSNSMNSRGDVGPGKAAESCHTAIDIVISRYSHTTRPRSVRTIYCSNSIHLLSLNSPIRRNTSYGSSARSAFHLLAFTKLRQPRVFPLLETNALMYTSSREPRRPFILPGHLV